MKGRGREGGGEVWRGVGGGACLANHWDMTPKQDRPLKMGEEGPRYGEGCGRGEG